MDMLKLVCSIWSIYPTSDKLLFLCVNKSLLLHICDYLAPRRLFTILLFLNLTKQAQRLTQGLFMTSNAVHKT
ncbi:CLUMA_CG006387, isoform A [Clunio marinus]|uniref:CLUMA_CG006387, isoform A n=1 Tax=Clunio marinus TaxID=568069 RepID=A0A1J1I1P8_9DIPT|nr:CLUMA_CG006387, isoform A [Clunio marinus]